MKELIKGETIRIDSHHNGIPIVWESDQDIHLDKETLIKYGGKPMKVQAKISLNSNRDVTINLLSENTVRANERPKIRQKMIKEIKEAFESSKNRKNRDEFLKALIDEVKLLNHQTDSIADIKSEIQKVFCRIMKCFGLNESTMEIMRNAANEYFQVYPEKNEKYFIFANKNNTIIGELDSRGEQEYAEKGFKISES